MVNLDSATDRQKTYVKSASSSPDSLFYIQEASRAILCFLFFSDLCAGNLYLTHQADKKYQPGAFFLGFDP